MQNRRMPNRNVRKWDDLTSGKRKFGHEAGGRRWYGAGEATPRLLNAGAAG
jgi:hypothetical protein